MKLCGLGAAGFHARHQLSLARTQRFGFGGKQRSPFRFDPQRVDLGLKLGGLGVAGFHACLQFGLAVYGCGPPRFGLLHGLTRGFGSLLRDGKLFAQFPLQLAARVERASGIGAQQQAGKGGMGLIKLMPDLVELGMVGLVLALLAPRHHDSKGAA